MPEYPDNSHSAREKSAAATPEKKFEKVVTGTTKTKKKSEAHKLAGLFAPDNIKSDILQDVIVPGIKRAIADIVSILLFGETGRIGGGSRKSTSSTISYQRYYDDRRDDRRDYSRPRALGGFEYDDIIFETRGDAELVLEQMDEALSQYNFVSVADLYDLAGVTCRGYTANKYGWADLRGSKIIRIREGYILQLPRTVQID